MHKKKELATMKTMQPDMVTTLPFTLGDTPTQIAVPSIVFFWGIGILIGFFALVSIILVYHWVHYGYEKTKISIATITYFLGSGVLIVLMILSASAYLLSV